MPNQPCLQLTLDDLACTCNGGWLSCLYFVFLCGRSLTKAKASATTEVRSQEQANMEFITKSGMRCVQTFHICTELSVLCTLSLGPMMGQRNQSLCSSNNSSNSSSPGQQSEVTIMVQDKLLGDKVQ